ncbi:hypothetical protein TNCV_2837281 [Trichonephila clavipes]|nr:hypothetical protein TNCV_2837281 [Trichonephila clavipes]
MGLDARLSLALSTIQVTVRFSSAKFPEGTIDGDTTYLHFHNVCMELKEREIFSSLCARDSAHKTSDPLINEHVLRVYSKGIWWHRASNQGLLVWSLML